LALWGSDIIQLNHISEIANHRKTTHRFRKRAYYSDILFAVQISV